jgi:hypothetical protein
MSAYAPIPDELFGRLAGVWSIARTISPDGRLTGTATFAPLANGWLRYHETGTLELPTGSFAAERGYLFAPAENGFAVYFDAEPLRLFHRIALAIEPCGTATGDAEHPCGRDLYATTYRFLPKGGFKVRHRVTGPHKDYVMDTDYVRATAQEIAA